MTDSPRTTSASEDPGFTLCQRLANLPEPLQELQPPDGYLRYNYSIGLPRLVLSEEPAMRCDPSKMIQQYREKLSMCANKQIEVLGDPAKLTIDLTRILGETTHRVMSLLLFVRKSLQPMGRPENELRLQLAGVARPRLRELMQVVPVLVSVNRSNHDCDTIEAGAKILNDALHPAELVQLYGIEPLDQEFGQKLISFAYSIPI